MATVRESLSRLLGEPWSKGFITKKRYEMPSPAPSWKLSEEIVHVIPPLAADHGPLLVDAAVQGNSHALSHASPTDGLT